MDYQVPGVPLDLENGEVCPCCGKFAKTYQRKLNSLMAKTLIWLYHTFKEGEWVHISKAAPKYILRNNEISRLLMWGLIEEKPNKDPKKNRSGVKRLTEKGRAFVLNKLAVPHHVLTYNNEKRSESAQLIFIWECFDEYFDYHQLMNNYN